MTAAIGRGGGPGALRCPVTAWFLVDAETRVQSWKPVHVVSHSWGDFGGLKLGAVLWPGLCRPQAP